MVYGPRLDRKWWPSKSWSRADNTVNLEVGGTRQKVSTKEVAVTSPGWFYHPGHFNRSVAEYAFEKISSEFERAEEKKHRNSLDYFEAFSQRRSRIMKKLAKIDIRQQTLN